MLITYHKQKLHFMHKSRDEYIVQIRIVGNRTTREKLFRDKPIEAYIIKVNMKIFDAALNRVVVVYDAT